MYIILLITVKMAPVIEKSFLKLMTRICWSCYPYWTGFILCRNLNVDFCSNTENVAVWSLLFVGEIQIITLVDLMCKLKVNYWLNDVHAGLCDQHESGQQSGTSLFPVALFDKATKNDHYAGCPCARFYRISHLRSNSQTRLNPLCIQSGPGRSHREISILTARLAIN